MVSSHRKLDEDEAKQILVQLDDGSTWKAELEDGEVVLVEQLTDPTTSPTKQPSSTSEPEPEPFDEEDEENERGEQQQADATDSAEPTESDEPDEQDTYDEMFEAEQPQINSYKDLFSKLPNINGIPEGLKDSLKDPAFRARLSSIMLDNKYDRRLRGRTRGKLDMGRLPKVPMMARNLFMQKQSRRGKNYNVTILVDQSGSMSGAKSKRAAEVGLFLLNAFDKIGINTCIIGFHDEIQVYRDWGSKKKYDDVYKDLLGNYGGNEDYDAMHFALEHFNKAPDEGENILLMLSDGAPTLDGHHEVYDEKHKRINFKFHEGDRDGTGEWEWKNEEEHLHHLVESYTHVKSIGIGIFAGGWQIPEHFVIQTLDDLKPTIIKVLGQKIKRG